MNYIIITFVSVALLSILIVLQVIRGSNNIVNNVHGNISDANNANKKRTQQEALLSELRQNFPEKRFDKLIMVTIIVYQEGILCLILTIPLPMA